jgi:3'-phosphoadenosine 5'-phosphosulfate sulfotransferase (PAPS reductase)/FAD synthetase
MRHVVFFSGGVGSWAAGKRIAAQYGTDGLTLLFTDTRIEDPDLYRFLDDAAANVGGDARDHRRRPHAVGRVS